VTAKNSQDDVCQLCGHDRFVHDDVLWPELIEAWELTAGELAYINIQQGTRCERCGANVRSQALARALLLVLAASATVELGASVTLDDWVKANVQGGPRLLEINEAGALTPWLSRFPGYVPARYPECDLTRLPHASESFDLVVHSDTLEHVVDPDTALRECRRVLAPGGACLFTVPIVAGRLTRSRAGLLPSYHGHADCREPDFMVRTEFGADVWTAVLEAGFATCQFVTFRYPAGVAIVARR
jgi:SAM-dependent methyltransferase